jgi:type I restriction enzyme S subunit
VGLVPREWKVDKLENHLIIKGRIGWKGLEVSEYTETGPFIVGGLQIRNNGVAWEDCAHVTEERYKESPEIMLQEKDILMTKDGTIGKLAYIEKLPGKATVASHIHVIRKKSEEVLPKFLFYFFRSPTFQSIVESKTSGSVVPALIQRDINSTFFPIPPLVEQAVIAQILSNLDAKIRLNLQMNKTLEELGQTIFKRWFVDFEFPNEEDKPYKSSGGKMTDIDELGECIPKGWEYGKVEDVAQVVGGGTPSTKVESHFTNDGIPWLTPKDLSGYQGKFIDRGATDITKEGLENSSAKLVPQGTILFTSRAPIGYAVIALNELATNQGFKSLVPKNGMKSDYLYQYVKKITPYIKSIASGSTFSEISGSAMRNVPIIIPEKGLIDRYEKLMSSINSRIINNMFNERTLDKVRNTLLPRLMSGRIRVPVLKEAAEA